MYNVTVGKVLSSAEALVVQLAVEKRLGISETRDLLQALPRQTHLRNAMKSEPLDLLRKASEFLNGVLTAPRDTPRDANVSDEVARKEGWIWRQHRASLPESD